MVHCYISVAKWEEKLPFLILLPFFQTWLLVVAAEKLFQEMMLDFGIYLKPPSCDWASTVDFLQKMTKSNFIQIENMTWLNSQRVDKPNYNGHKRLNNSQDFANLIYHFSEMGQNRKRFVKTQLFLRTLIYSMGTKNLRKLIACSSVVTKSL